jgi:ribosomal protein L29
MNDTTKKLEISQKELELIASALETQSKILRMQASAGGHGAIAQLNEVKRVLATVSSNIDVTSTSGGGGGRWWNILRSTGQTV